MVSRCWNTRGAAMNTAAWSARANTRFSKASAKRNSGTSCSRITAMRSGSGVSGSGSYKSVGAPVVSQHTVVSWRSVRSWKSVHNSRHPGVRRHPANSSGQSVRVRESVTSNQRIAATSRQAVRSRQLVGTLKTVVSCRKLFNTR